MITKKSVGVPSTEYDKSLVSRVVFPPLRGLSRIGRDICNGWIDCGDSFGEWVELSPWEFEQPNANNEFCQSLLIDSFFGSLGSWLSGRNEYRTPWDEFLYEVLSMGDEL